MVISMIGFLEVTKAGMASIQDKGRYGNEKYGFGVSGALDQYAFKISNALLGNELNEPVIENVLSDIELRSNRTISIAITGAPCDVTIDDKEYNQWEVIMLERNKALSIKNIHKGARVYISVANGFKVKKVHGSASYDDTLGIGTLLSKGDEIKFKNSKDISYIRNWNSLPDKLKPKYGSPWEIKFTRGPDHNIFKNHIKFFEDVSFEVSTDSNNMGIRLNRVKIINYKDFEVISRGIIPGAIEITPSGQPIVLHRGRGGTIGYPVLGCVTSHDLNMIGQVRPRDEVRFKYQEIEEAQNEYIDMNSVITNIYENIKK